MAFAGMDVGTSGCKLFVYDLKGNIIYKASGAYQEYGSNGYREIKADDVIKQVEHILKEAGYHCPEKIEALAIASLGESIVCLDKEGSSLCPSMVTGDKRGILENKRLIAAVGAERIFNITGLPPSEMYGLPKYMWQNENTDAIQKADKIFFYEDYVGYILTGKRMVSYSSASRSMAFDIRKKTWCKELLDYAGIRTDQMSIPVEAGTVIGTINRQAAERLHLNQDMVIAAGGHDQSCAALGSGLSRKNVGECGMGTCEFMFLMLPQVTDHKAMIESDFTRVPYVFPQTYLTSLEVTTCGILKNWCRDTFLKSFEQECSAGNLFSFLDQKIKDHKTDILVLPQFGSSGNPDINYDVKGTITGLTIHTKPEEIYLAVLEGIAFQMLMSYRRVQKLGAFIDQLICTGGGAKSEITLQIRADIFQMDIITIHSEESGTLGCMMLAAVGTGNFASMEEAIENVVQIKKVYHPRKAFQDYYTRKYEKFLRLYEVMHVF